jgi:MFS family permease
MGMSSGQAFFSDLTDKQHRGRINALWNVAGTMQTFSIGVSPGSLLGATGNFIGGYLHENVSKQFPLLIQSVMVGLTAVTGIVFLKEPKRESEHE